MEGDGADKDIVKSIMWLNIAASQGDKTAKTLLKTYEPLSSLIKVEQARKLAKECVQKQYQGC